MAILRISAKNLGALATPEFCPRCFWLKMKCRRGLPSQCFPGIFSSIDSYSKRVTNCCYKRSSLLPEWFDGFAGLLKPVRVPHHTVFNVIDPATGIRLTGVPDEIFERRDGSYFIADYKTARFTDVQDHLLPLYRVQLNVYAYIGARAGFSPVTGIGLIYYEPQMDLTTGLVEEVVLRTGFVMPFNAKLVEIDLAPASTIPPLLREVRRISDSVRPPTSREGCQDCEQLDDVLALMR